MHTGVTKAPFCQKNRRNWKKQESFLVESIETTAFVTWFKDRRDAIFVNNFPQLIQSNQTRAGEIDVPVQLYYMLTTAKYYVEYDVLDQR